MRWRVNLVVDNTDVSGRPVVMETEPSYTNLFGTIERTLTQSGEAATSFMRIRAGALMRANGGFLVLNADDLFMEPRVWPGLKRALKYRRVQIQSLESLILGAALLKPEPVPINVKVVIIGSRAIYDLLYRHDSDFSKIFKVLADFDTVLAKSKSHARDVLSVLRRSPLTRVCASSIAAVWPRCSRRRYGSVDGEGGFRAVFRTSRISSGRPRIGRVSKTRRWSPSST